MTIVMAEELTGQTSRTGHRVIRKREMVRILLLIFGIATVGGLFLLQLAQSYLATINELAQSNPAQAAQRIGWLLGIVLMGMVVFALAAGGTVIWYGARALRSECFPPPGSWVIEGRQIHTGAKARRLGKVHILLGAVMASTSCIAVYIGWKLLQLL